MQNQLTCHRPSFEPPFSGHARVDGTGAAAAGAAEAIGGAGAEVATETAAEVVAAAAGSPVVELQILAGPESLAFTAACGAAD